MDYGNGNEKVKVDVSTTNGQVDIRTGKLPDLPEIFQFDGYNFELESAQSLIDLILRKGDSSKTIITGNEKGIFAVLDDTIKDRPQDTAWYPYIHSIEYDEWTKILNVPIKQKALVDFLRGRPNGQVFNADALLAAVQTLKIDTQITGEFEYNDNNNVTIAFKIKEGEGTVTLPKKFDIFLPLVLGSSKEIIIEVELEFNVPKSDSEKPFFVLKIPKYNYYWQKVTQEEFKKLKEALPGYLILDGKKGF